ncbi:MAG: F0F1 ATP synthase subunit B [Magnetococcales bacterium]|nr:F0F1 ATP synthase subunit B [Magnetococcales bacterium]
MISVAHASEGAHAASGGGGLPQFDASTFSSQFFWTLVSFLALLFLLNKYVIPAINRVLDAREKTISGDLSNAENMKKEAQQVLADYQAKLRDSAKKAEQTLADAQKEAAQNREQALKELNAELQKKQDSATEAIEQAKRKAIEEVKVVAADLAIITTQKLISKSVTKTEANKMVTEAISEMESAGSKALN